MGFRNPLTLAQTLEAAKAADAVLRDDLETQLDALDVARAQLAAALDANDTALAQLGADLAGNAATLAALAQQLGSIDFADLTGTIAAQQIAGATIVASMIAADAITADKIAADAITADEISAGAVIAGKIAAGAVTATELAAGSVLADKLTAVLELVSTVIAGDPNGTHARLDPDGLHVYKADPVDGVPNEVVRLGVAGSNDYLAVTSSAGDVLASLDETGTASFTAANVQTEVNVCGRPLLGDTAGWTPPLTAYALTTQVSWLDQLPRGIVASAYGLGSNGAYNIQSTIGLFELSYVEQPGRNYKISVAPLLVSTNVNATSALMTLKASIGTGPANAPAPTVNSTPIASAFGPVMNASQANAIPGLLAHGRVSGNNDYPTQVRLLLCLERFYGTGQIQYYSYPSTPYTNAMRIIVEDIGPDTVDTFNSSSGGGTWYAAPATPPPAAPASKQNYTTEWAWTGHTNYVGGNKGGTSISGAVQGQIPGVGLGTSYLDFDDAAIRAALSGATVTSAELYLYFAHWYNNAGGTARVALSNQASAPAMLAPSTAASVESAGWPNPGGRWVQLPTPDGWRTGAVTGVVLTPAGSSSYQFYGYVTDARLRINYTK